jgi:hypothetical protein
MRWATRWASVVGLARAGAGDDQQRPGRPGADAMLDGLPLLRVERGEMVLRGHAGAPAIRR